MKKSEKKEKESVNEEIKIIPKVKKELFNSAKILEEFLLLAV